MTYEDRLDLLRSEIIESLQKDYPLIYQKILIEIQGG